MMPEWKLALIRAAGKAVESLNEVAKVTNPDNQATMQPILNSLITSTRLCLDAVNPQPVPAMTPAKHEPKKP